MQNIWSKIQKSLWKIAAGLLAFITIILLIAYFMQGAGLAENALNNAQRIIIPLKGDGEWIGKKIIIKEAAKEKTETEPETETAAIETEEPAKPSDNAIDGVVETNGVADEHSKTEIVVSDALKAKAEEANVEEATAEATAVISERKPVKKRANGKPLAIAPAAELSEKLDEYILPKISDDGKKPWQYYGKPFTSFDVPIIAVVIRGLGLGRITTENALNLDGNITLSFSPYAKNTQMWGSHARNIGHEILLDLPQESKNFPAVDPGPYALLNTLDEDSNKQRLHWVMSRVAGYTGFLQTENPALQSGDMQNAFTEVANRGLFLIEAPAAKTENLTKNQEQMGLITRQYDVSIDEILSEEEIQKQLDLLVKKAKLNGTVIAVARPYPLTLELLDKWSEGLAAQGVKLAPVSAIIAHDL